MPNPILIVIEVLKGMITKYQSKSKLSKLFIYAMY
jgi:hypothetical protein